METADEQRADGNKTYEPILTKVVSYKLCVIYQNECTGNRTEKEERKITIDTDIEIYFTVVDPCRDSDANRREKENRGE